MNMIKAVVLGFILMLPLFAIHLFANVYVEPTIERSDDCKDPNARPGSRADSSMTMRFG